METTSKPIISDNSAMKVYEKRRINFAFQGLLIAMLSGMGAALYGHIMTGVFESPAVAIGTTVVIVAIISIVCQGISDFLSGGWLFILNLFTGRGIKEYARLLKTKKLAGMLLLAGLFGGPMATGAYLLALNLCGVTPALILSALGPIFSAIISRILYKERLNSRVIIGIIIAITGVSICGYAGSISTDAYPHFVLGIVFAIGAALGWGLEASVATYASDMTDPYTAVGIFRTLASGLFALVIMVPIVGLMTKEGLVAWTVIVNVFTTPNVLMWMLLGSLVYGLTYLTTYIAFDRTGACRSLVFINMSGIWSAVFGVVFAAFGWISYSVSIFVVVGGIVLLAGATLVAGHPRDLIRLRDV